MAVDEIIAQVRTLPAEDLRRVRAAIDARLAAPLTEDEVVTRMVAKGLLTLPKPGKTYDPTREPPPEIEGEPLSETLLRERR
jgi:hypothetical protein